MPGSTPDATPAEPTTDLGLVDGVVQLSFAVHELLGTLASRYDLSITQVRMLGVLRDRELGMLDLARFLSLEKSSVTGLVDRAEQRGLVERVRPAHDGRVIHVRLTAAGRQAATVFTSDVGAGIAGLVGGLSARDQAQLSRLASRIVHGYAGSRGLDLETGRR